MGLIGVPCSVQLGKGSPSGLGHLPTATHVLQCRFIDAAIPDLTSEQKAALRGRNKRPAPESGARETQQGKNRGKSRDAKLPQQQEAKQPSRQATQQFLQELVSGTAEGSQPVGAQQTADIVQDADALIQQVMASLDDGDS